MFQEQKLVFMSTKFRIFDWLLIDFIEIQFWKIQEKKSIENPDFVPDCIFFAFPIKRINFWGLQHMHCCSLQKSMHQAYQIVLTRASCILGAVCIFWTSIKQKGDWSDWHWPHSAMTNERTIQFDVFSRNFWQHMQHEFITLFTVFENPKKCLIWIFWANIQHCELCFEKSEKCFEYCKNYF